MATDGEGLQDIGADTVRDVDDLDRLRRRLANVIGHALRTPAATVRGQAEILGSTDDPELRAQSIASLRRTARRLEEMIDEILVVQGIDTTLPTGRVERVTVADEARRVAADLDVVDDLELLGDTSVQVLAGRDAVGWLLRTVLDNAARYGDGAARLELQQRGTRVRLLVSSPRGGAPMTDEDLQLAFEPFYRGERAVTVTATRLGVGLTIARRLVTDLGGEIHLEQGDPAVTTVLELPRP